MVQGSHPENALSPQLERRYLNNDRQSFSDEDTTDEDQEKFLLDNHGHRADGAAERQRSHITHEDFRWMRVVPEEPQTCSNHRSAKDRQLAGLTDVLEIKVVGKHRIAGHIGQRSQRRRSDKCAANSETIEPIGQVHRV